MSIIAKLKDTRALAFRDITYSKHVHLPTGLLGRPNISPPTIVIQDNIKLLAFTVDTDRVFYTWKVPDDYAGGNLDIVAHWTNDGGVDDLNKNVKAQIDYQTYSDGDPVSGSHANSPKSIDDTYLSAAGWIFHTTGAMTIAAADFNTKHEMAIKLSFITALPTVLTCEPHLDSLMLTYTAYANQ